jgi:hypothetical protein
MEIVVMSNKDRDASSATIESTPEKSAHKTHPAPPMVWMLLPVALLALLAFLSR